MKLDPAKFIEDTKGVMWTKLEPEQRKVSHLACRTTVMHPAVLTLP